MNNSPEVQNSFSASKISSLESNRTILACADNLGVYFECVGMQSEHAGLVFDREGSVFCYFVALETDLYNSNTLSFVIWLASTLFQTLIHHNRLA